MSRDRMCSSRPAAPPDGGEVLYLRRSGAVCQERPAAGSSLHGSGRALLRASRGLTGGAFAVYSRLDTFVSFTTFTTLRVEGLAGRSSYEVTVSTRGLSPGHTPRIGLADRTVRHTLPGEQPFI